MRHEAPGLRANRALRAVVPATRRDLCHYPRTLLLKPGHSVLDSTRRPRTADDKRGSAQTRSTRLHFICFRIGEEELAVAFDVALELAERARGAPTRMPAWPSPKIRGAGASGPIV